MKILKVVLISLSVLLLLAVGSQSVEKDPRQPSEPPNIILISIDTWRGDYFTPEVMPELYDFAKKNCMIYTNAQSTSTWTKPSHVTMLTGLLQSEHGVEYNDSSIPPALTMVQQRLKDAGYTTAAFVGGAFVSREWGFDRGFDTFWDGYAPSDIQSSSSLTYEERYQRKKASFDKAEQYISRGPRQPLFLFVHSYMVHEYWNLYFPQDQEVGAVMEKLRQDKRFAELQRPDLGKFISDATPGQRREEYAAAVLDCDRRLHQFLAALRQSPLFSNAKIIITSDHGEGLGDVYEDYVSILHAEPPYKEQTHVPLIVYGQGVGETDQLVGIDDIAGTILKFAGIEQEPKKSLFRKRDFVIAEDVHLVRDNPQREIAVISKTERFLLAGDGSVRLFDNPRDHDDLIDSHASPFVGWAAIKGLYEEEGPYPQWNLPVLRWAHGPQTVLKFLSDGCPAKLVLGFRRNKYPDQTFAISMNGERLKEFKFGADFNFHLLDIPLLPREGENTLLFEFSRMEGDRELTVCFDRIMVLPEPLDPHLSEILSGIDIKTYPFTGWDTASGLGPESGPFPQLDLPVIRWGLGPQTDLYFESKGDPLVLSMICGPMHILGQELKVFLNGDPIYEYRFNDQNRFEDMSLPFTPKIGENRLTFEYATWDKSDPEYPIGLLFKRLRIAPPELSISSDTARKGT